MRKIETVELFDCDGNKIIVNVSDVSNFNALGYFAEGIKNEEIIDFNKMTIAQLQKYAAENNIELGSAKKKEDILAIIANGN